MFLKKKVDNERRFDFIFLYPEKDLFGAKKNKKTSQAVKLRYNDGNLLVKILRETAE